MSGVDCERPINRYQPPDWHDRNASLVEKATTTRHVSVARRREAQELKIETDSRTKWSNFENNVKLQERAQEIERWQRELAKLLDEVLMEISTMEGAKENCERAMESLVTPYEIVVENIAVREGRRAFEVVKDPVEHSLKSEKKLIDMVRSKLKSACEDSWQQLAVLEQIKQNLELDLEDKTEALNIDMDQLRLSERSAGLTRKPNAIRNPKSGVPPAAWTNFSFENKQQAERELAKTQKIREFIFHTIEQANNDIAFHVEQTNFDFRKRMFEMKRAREECDYQMKVTQDEIDEQLSTIRQLEIAIDAKDGPLKLAETRLENRQNRPMQELCTDLPLEGLIDEVQTIKESIVKLEDKLDNAKETLSELHAYLQQLREDKDRKAKAYSLDQQCIDARAPLSKYYTLRSDTDRNLKLTGSLRQKTRFLENSTATK